MKKMNRLFLFGITFLAFVLSSCTVGLGEAVDLSGPEITILTPAMRECVNENFTISGTAFDEFGIKTLTVTLDDNEWKNTDGKWRFKAKGNDAYVDVPAENAKWEIQGDRTIKWELSNVNVETQGKQLLVVSAVDTSGRTSANSQKKITIIVDNKSPAITLSSPNIKYQDFDEIKTAFQNVNDYKQIQIVNSLETGAFTVSGTAEDENTVVYVRVYVNAVDAATGETSAITEKNIVLTDSGVDFPNPIYKDSLRTWSVDITDDDLLSLDSSKNYLQIATESSDNSGNKTYGIKTQGYILLWKDADTPWVTANLSTTEAECTEVYSGSSIQGTAFDNAQVSKVLLTVNEKDGNEWKQIAEFTEKEIYKFDEIANDGETTQSVGFQITYPTDVNTYQLLIKAIDQNGNESESIIGYVKVQDKTYPSIKFDEISHPYGDKNGDIKIDFTVSDDIKVKSVKVVESKDAKYFQKNDADWKDMLELPFTFVGEDSPDDFFTRKKYTGSHTFNVNEKLIYRSFIFLVEDGEGNKTVSKYVYEGDTTPPEITLLNIDGTELPYLDSATGKEKALPGFNKDTEIIISGKWQEDSYDNEWKEIGLEKYPKIKIFS